MEEHDSIDLRSKAFQEILGEPPSWLLRWGISAILIAFIALFIVGYFLEFPETVTASVRLETANPPVEVGAPVLGTISNFIPEDSLVKKETILAQISDNSGDYNTILALSEALSEYTRTKIPPNLNRFEFSEIGIIQKDLFEYLQLARGNSNSSNPYFNQALGTFNQNIDAIKQEIEDLNNLINLKQEELLTIPDRRVSLQKIYSDSTNGKNRAALMQLRSDEKRMKDDIKIYEGQIAQKQRDIKNFELRKSDLQNDSKETQNTRKQRLELSLLRLKTEVEAWKNSHVIKAPITGTIYHLDKLKAKEFLIEKGDKLFSIVPLGSQDSIEGKLYLPSEASLKINIGQPVKIKFNAYKPAEYGLLNGVIADKATIPQNGQYQITVALKDRMLTSKGKMIPFEHQMLGEAKIITEDRRFTGIIFDQFREMMNR